MSIIDDTKRVRQQEGLSTDDQKYRGRITATPILLTNQLTN